MHGVVRGVRRDQERRGLLVAHRVGYLEHRRDPDRHRREAAERLDADRGDPLAEEAPVRGRGVDHHADTFLARHVGHRHRHRIRAARHGHVGERERSHRHAQDHPVGERLDARLHRHPAAHVHAETREVGGRRLRDLVEDEHVGGLAVFVDAPRLHAGLRSSPAGPATYVGARVAGNQSPGETPVRSPRISRAWR